MELWTAFLIGLLGSFHCVGMCGPIALSLPINSTDKLNILFDLLIYNIGRIFTYSLIGGIVGLFGTYIFYSGYQQEVSVFLGIIILLSVVLHVGSESKFSKIIGVYRFYNWLSRLFSRYINGTGKFPLIMIGLLNGFLPCGLVYMAVAGAFTNYSIQSAMLYMLFFGLGTLPLMLAVSIIGRSVHGIFKVRKLIPIVAFAMGILFILRGLNLGIPYVSPKIDKQDIHSQEIICE